MSKEIKIIIAALVVVGAVGVGFYFNKDILSFYHQTADNFQQINKTDFSGLVNAIKQEITAPSPLTVGGNPSNVVLVSPKVIAQTNIARYDNGQLPPLIENKKLDEAALAKANDMFAKQYFEHVSPAGVGPGDLAKSFGYDYVLEGENLILGNFQSEKEMVQDWMNSPGHRANILNNRFADIGVAVVKGTYKGQTVWIGVQEFGLPLSVCKQPSVALKSQIDTDTAALDQLSVTIDQLKVQIENTSQRSKQYNDLVDEYNKLVGQYNALAQETKAIIAQYNIQVNTFNACVSGE